MSRSRSHSDTSIGLFAFLDVLMVTMGSLILLLIVVTPKIRQETVARVAAAQLKRDADEASRRATVATPVIAPPVETIDLNSQLKRDVAVLSGQVERRKSDVAKRRAASANGERDLQQAEADFHSLEQRIAELRQAKNGAVETAAKISAEGVEVESRLTREAARLRKIRGEIAHASTKYKFVAYDGVSGTVRRPILIECTREHIKFLQENIAITAQDIEGFTPSFNPVLAGSMALIDYWSTHSGPDDPRPYILIIVRPSGSVAYHAVRKLLERMQDPFGYELLCDDQKLDVPPADPGAVAACRKAIEKTMSGRESLLQALRRVDGGGRGRGRAGDGRVGGGAPVISHSGSAGFDRSLLEDPGVSGSHGRSRADRGDESPSLAANGRGGADASREPGGGSDTVSATPSSGDGVGPGGPLVGGSGGPLNDLPAAGAPGPAVGLGGSPRNQPPNQPLNQSGQRGIGPLGTGRAWTGQGGTGSAESGPFMPGLEGSGSNGSGPAGAGQTGTGLAANGRAGTGQPGNGDPGTGQPAEREPGTGHSGSDPSRSGRAGSGQTGSVRADQGSPGADDGGGEPLDGGSRSDTDGGNQRSRSRAVRSALGGDAGDAGDSGDSGEGGGAGGLNPGDPLAGRMKRRWGMSSPHASIGYEKEVVIHVEAQRIFVGEEAPIPCGFGESSNELVARVIGALQRESRAWGRPPENFYWVPSIKFVISPGGNQHYERIRRGVARHGLVSSVEYRLDSSPRKTPRTTETE